MIAISAPKPPPPRLSRPPKINSNWAIWDEADRATDGRRDRADERVAVLDVGQLVGEDARELAVVHEIEQTGRDRDGGVLGIAAGRERVRLGPVDDVQAGHRQAGPLRERGDDLAEAGELVGAQLAGPVRLQGERVTLPVDEAVHREREHERDDHAGLASEEAADEHEQPGKGGEKGEGLDGVVETEVHAGIEGVARLAARPASGRPEPRIGVIRATPSSPCAPPSPHRRS